MLSSRSTTQGLWQAHKRKMEQLLPKHMREDVKPAPDGGSGWYYYEYVNTSHTDEPWDVVEPEYHDAMETIREAGYVIDYEKSGCDHDSFWIRFDRAADSAEGS